MSDIVRKKIVDPSRIEKNCARINRAASSGGREIGRYFQTVLQYWTEEDFVRAVETAEYAAKKYPSNPDIWCLLGRAYLRLSSPNAKKADASLRKASELGCQRGELAPLRIEAKELLEDWLGIVQLLDELERAPTGPETLLLARANRALGDIQSRAGSWASAESYYLRGASLIHAAFLSRNAYGYVEPLKALKADLAILYVTAVRRRTASAGDSIEIWDAVAKVWHLEVHHRDLMSAGFQAARDWSSAVLMRTRFDETTLQRMRELRRSMRSILDTMHPGPGWALVMDVGNGAARAVESAIERYSRSR
jgi:tetratricopeptide (TPR) repeat protein